MDLNAVFSLNSAGRSGPNRELDRECRSLNGLKTAVRVLANRVG